KRRQPSAPLVREEFVVRDVGEAIGEIGEEGPRIAAARNARRWVTPENFPWLTDDQIETAKLLISEMVANALRWTDGKVAVITTATDTGDTRRTRFTVTDDSTVVPKRTGMPGWDAERGRGGEFVAMMSDAHGATAHENGKSTWFELHGPRGDEPDAGESNTPGSGHPGAPSTEPPPASTPVQPDGDHAQQTDEADVATPDGEPVPIDTPRDEEQAGTAMRQAAEVVLTDTPASTVAPGDTPPTRDQRTTIEFVVRPQGSDPSDEAARMRAGSQAWDQLSDHMFDWPADKIDDAGLELAELVMATLENGDDGSARVALEESGDPGERLLHVTVGDSSFEV
ncbi:hypothetical protein, partial [Nocardia sp. NPDC019302]|uniref:ATP-binding protein n=1 Tax=Nocardia sp. NPDC019302 TaxID=3154592 RepID=UPI0033FD866D